MDDRSAESAPEGALSDEDYERLAELRYALRRFLHWSERQAQRAGLTPAQHQLLLSVRASRDPRGPTVGQIAEFLLVRPHSAVGLVDRAQAAGFVRRDRDRDQPSVVRVTLTERGAAKLASLSELHLRELSQLAPTMAGLWAAVAASESDAAGAQADG
jgi:DNA-binding MarR family transcriptional regulator